MQVCRQYSGCCLPSGTPTQSPIQDPHLTSHSRGRSAARLDASWMTNPDACELSTICSSSSTGFAVPRTYEEAIEHALEVHVVIARK